MGLIFQVKSPNCDEKLDNDNFSYEKIESIALAKAQSLNNNEDLIIAADTVVVIDNKILGKPKDNNDALNMLKSLQGHTHFVVTSVAVVFKGFVEVQSDTTYVTFNSLKDEELLDYINTCKPLDKAGAYGIQELPENFVKSIDGNFDNVVGLPSSVLAKMLINMQKKS